MKRKPIIKEEWEKLENELAQELLKSSSYERKEKYTEVYERLYSSFPEEKRLEMSNNYLRGASNFSRFLRKVVRGRKSVLDIGCGFGHLSALLAEQKNFVTGIDINRIHIREANQKYGFLENLKFEQTRGAKLNFPDEKFDFVVSTSVVEHLHPEDIELHFKEVKRILKKNGVYIFNTISAYVSNGSVNEFSTNQEVQQKTGFHIFVPNWSEMNTLLRNIGFNAKTDILPTRLTKKLPFFIFFVPLSFKVWLETIVKLSRFKIRLFKLTNMLIYAKKK